MKKDFDQNYSGFAEVYDQFMDNVPYDEWTEYITSMLRSYGVKDGLVLELGCGTGMFTRRLRAAGYDMIGLDVSEEMLEVARTNEDEGILYLHQDMREFELFGTVAAVVGLCDSLNYIIEEEDLLRVFTLVNNYLDRNGIFLFDLNTEYYFREELGDNTFAENREDASLIWENYYDEDEKLNEYQITVFRSVPNDGKQLFERSVETHLQRCYSVEKIQNLLEKAGMEFVGAFEHLTFHTPKADSIRICVVAREKAQEGKKYVET